LGEMIDIMSNYDRSNVGNSWKNCARKILERFEI
jgi:hypothetical protein